MITIVCQLPTWLALYVADVLAVKLVMFCITHWYLQLPDINQQFSLVQLD